MRRAILALALALPCALAPARARAHSRPLSYSFWTFEPGGAQVRIQITTRDLELIGFELDPAADQGAQAARVLQRQLVLQAGDEICAPRGAATSVASDSGWVVMSWHVRCESRGARRITARFVRLLKSGHRHLVRLDDGRGHVLDQVLDLSHPSWTIDAFGPGAAPEGSSLLDYLRLGVQHLLTGWDHMAFLLGLLLLASRAREVVALVTSFTLAHSATLALSVLGIARPDPAPVEALIGFSIALLGAENCWLLARAPEGQAPAGGATALEAPRVGPAASIPAFAVLSLPALALAGGGVVTRAALLGLSLFCACHFGLLWRARAPSRLRIVIAFAFGLIHGFGFAGAMKALELPRARLAPALLGFNLGVELGQLVIVLLLWPVLLGLRRSRQAGLRALFDQTASAALCGLGIYWFVVRSFG